MNKLIILLVLVAVVLVCGCMGFGGFGDEPFVVQKACITGDNGIFLIYSDASGAQHTRECAYSHFSYDTRGDTIVTLVGSVRCDFYNLNISELRRC